MTVTRAQPGSRMVWEGGMPLGLFTGVRTFTLRPTTDGTTEFSMKEEYRGALAPLITRSIPDLTRALASSPTGLKTASER